MTAPSALRLRALGGQLESFGWAGHPLGIRREKGENLAEAILTGTPAHLALEDAGAPERVVRFVKKAAPPDVAWALEALSAALGRSDARSRLLAGRALYPLTLVVLSGLLAALVFFELRPAMEFFASAERGAGVSLPVPPFVFLLAVSLGGLAYLVLALRLERPMFPFARVRTAHQCATLLAAAASVAAQKVDLPTSLRAAAELVSSRVVKDSAEGLARSLDEGQPSWHGTLLLGEAGAALFAQAATQGAGAESLQALADYSEAVADSALPMQLLRAELMTLLLAGLAVAAAAACFMHTYSHALVRW